jgi:cell growth-regulating nucleolar protein
MIHFQGTDYRAHTVCCTHRTTFIACLTSLQSCISEAQKYQGALYRPEKQKKQQNNQKALVPHKAYVEDVEEDYHHNSHIQIVDPPMPQCPSPPSAAPGFKMSQESVNVFDFLVDSETPNGSRLELTAPEPMNLIEDTPRENTDRDLVRVRFNEQDELHYKEEAAQSLGDLIEYGSGPIPTSAYQTPAPKEDRERRKEKKDRDLSREEKKDKKRKRLHVDTQDLSSRGLDEIMTDAPPVLHSGLTGGLGRLLSRPSVFPPSPDYSGGDHEASPGSPLKKTKHSKRGRRVDAISNNIMSLISTNSSREHSSHSEDRPRRKHRRHREHSHSERKMIEYAPLDSNSAVNPEDSQNQLVLFQPRAELLLSFINKGPESEKGVSMNKALKRYHRERNLQSGGLGLSRGEEEKELWRSLRMKRNERGEIVLFL